MADELPKVGEWIGFQSHGKRAGTLEVESITTDDGGKRQIQLEVIELVQDYAGDFMVGMVLSVPEDRFVGTLTPKK